MSNQSLVSIIVPTYNRKELLIRAIESILQQTYQNFEIIVIDDGSSDGTKEALTPYLTDNKIRYYYKTNEGLPSLSRNYGINKAQGQFIAFLDCDDYWYPNKLEKQLTILNKYSKYQMVFCPAVAELNNKKVILGNEFFIKKSGSVFWWLIIKNFIITSSVIVRADTLKEVGLFKPLKISEDFDLWLRIALRNKVKFIDEALVYYQFHDSNISADVMTNIDCGDAVVKSYLKDLNLPSYLNNFINSLIPFKKFLRLRKKRESISFINDAIKMSPFFLPYRIIKFFYFW